MKKAAIIMGSDSDFPVVKKAGEVLESFGIPVEWHVMSAHRSPSRVSEFAKNAVHEGFGVIIAAAGMAAHLAGAIAANTVLPVIGLPVKAKALEGVDALLSTAMMPPGIPVATVGIDAAANAGHLAAEILAISDPELRETLEAFRKRQNQKNIEADEALQDKVRNL